jgi:TolA-binding protein
MSQRSELKENILAGKMEVALKWALENRQQVLTALGIGVGVILIASVYFLRKQEQRASNFTRLAQAEFLLNQKKYPESKQILNEIRASTNDNQILIHTLYYLGQNALAERNADEAIQVFSDVIRRASNSPIKPLALVNLAYAYELKKDYASAAQTYQQFADNYPDHFLAARTQLQLGRVLALAGKSDESRKALTQLIDLYPTSAWAENARAIMDKNKTR